jgi:hypothetical protein
VKNFILEYPFFYRLYQSTVRKKKHEYLFFNYIFSSLSKNGEIRMLDICSGDSHVLNYISNYLNDYIGVDLNNKYLQNLSTKWPRFTFLNLDVTGNNSLEELKKFNPNFIFMNGAIHHLNDKTMKSVISLIRNFNDAYFLSVDPVDHKNKLINKIMIKNDRGKFIRSPEEYNSIMSNFNSLIIDDFYIMSFKNIFHFKNINLEKLYKEWQSL